MTFIYRGIVRAKLKRLVSEINRHNLDYVVAQFSPDAEHIFPGSSHALSGVRRSPDLIAAWYQRLGAIFPTMNFEIRRLLVNGPPWNTNAVVEVKESSTDRQGNRMFNDVALFIRIRWGRATQLRVYCDTDLLMNNLKTLASQGVSEAGQEPIEGPL